MSKIFMRFFRESITLNLQSLVSFLKIPVARINEKWPFGFWLSKFSTLLGPLYGCHSRDAPVYCRPVCVTTACVDVFGR